MKAKIFNKLSNIFLGVAVIALALLIILAITNTVILCINICTSADYKQLMILLNGYIMRLIVLFLVSGLLMLITHNKYKEEIKK